jgi:hypothetical protein
MGTSGNVTRRVKNMERSDVVYRHQAGFTVLDGRLASPRHLASDTHDERAF